MILDRPPGETINLLVESGSRAVGPGDGPSGVREPVETPQRTEPIMVTTSTPTGSPPAVGHEEYSLQSIHPAPVCWQALAEDTGVCVLVHDTDGKIEFVNGEAARVLGVTADAVRGQHLRAVMPTEVADERVQYARRAVESGKPLIVDGMFGGRMRRAHVRPVPGEHGEPARVLIVCHPISATTPAEPGVERIEARHSDEGPIGSLTPREREVLALIGQGLSTADIAKKLHRSVKTVEWHRVSLGNKLGASNRVELARIAIRAGLASLDE